jgi:hypothetical protein
LRLAGCRLARIRLVIRLVGADQAQRMPDPAPGTRLGCDVDYLSVHPRDVFALALARALQGAMDDGALPGPWFRSA